MYRLDSRAASTSIWSLLPRNANTPRQVRFFHVTGFSEAQPRASPKIRARMQTQQGAVRVKKTPAIEESLPPLVLLNSARKSGVLSIEPEKALEFLRQYHELSTKHGGLWEQKLCDEHNIDPATVGTLAGILRRSTNKAQQSFAKRVMLTASALGNNSSTFEIISSAIRLGKLHEYPAPLQRVGILAKKNNDPQAWTLLGQVYLARRANSEALDCFRKATRPPTGGLGFYGAGDALVNEGRILLGLNDKDGAKAAFEKAALELDDPSAYFYLSKHQEPGSKKEQVYLLKAASSGIAEAWHNLGARELEKQKGAPTKPAKVEDFGMAYEWFQVAATDGFGLSMLNLALMCKSVGNIEEGLKWLAKAEDNVEVRDQATLIRSQFQSGKVGAI